MPSRYREVGPVATLLIGLSLLSCSRTFTIKADGDIHDSIKFSFYRNDEPVDLRIVEFVVQQKASDGHWSVIWELHGAEDLSAIEYGKQYNGLAIAVPPKTLQPDTRYRALAHELSGLNPEGHSAVAFSLDEGGHVMPDSLLDRLE
jgi:hypothetical protein